MTRFLVVTVVALGTIAVIMAVSAAVAKWRGRADVVDVVWGPGFAVVSLVCLVVGDGSLERRALMAALVSVWGLRLGLHLRRRVAGSAEDPRYTEMLGEEPRSVGTLVRKVFGLQGAAMWFVALPVQVAAVESATVGVVGWVGVALWIVGLVFEAVGDAQLARFKADPGNRGRIMDQGLWGWTRHPNYFGDACVWWGIFLVAADAWPGVLTILSPVAMTYFLVRGTGARVLERRMAERSGYRQYMARTSGFVPLPPRGSPG